jgi:hypothetical protein
MHKRHLIKLVGLTVLAAISVMAVSATAAQAKYTLLLNGKHVAELHLLLKNLPGELKAENGLKIKCSAGEGLAIAKLVEEGKKVTGSAEGTFKGCVWVGSESTCTINDGGAGQIKAKGTGEVVMTGEQFRVTATSTEFATVFTEGIFCTIPEEEVVSGTADVIIEGEEGATMTEKLTLPKGKVLTGHLENLSLKLGNSKVTELKGDVHISDFLDPTATIGIHLCGLSGTPAC